LITAAFLAIRARQFVLTGFFLALSTIKPLMVALVVIYVLLWLVAQRQYLVLWSFFGFLALMIAVTSLVIPDWLIQLTKLTVVSFDSIRNASAWQILIAWLPGVGKQIGWILTAFVVITLMIEWRASINQDFRWFFWTACLTLTLTGISGLPTSMLNFIILLPTVILIQVIWDERWGKIGRLFVVLSILLLSVGLWAVYFHVVQAGEVVYQNPGLFFALPIFCLIGLYWVRWWAIHPPRLPLQQLVDSLQSS
jgi:hypothetical protein